MELSILLGIAGIIVSIGVGFGTFYLADKRAKRNRWVNAKETVLRDLSKSLSEGTIPDALVIRATIRSVLRSHNASDLSVVSLDEIADDLLRQITADPFLESERRKQLQNEILELKQAQKNLEAQMSPEEKEVEFSKVLTSERFTWSTIASISVGIVSSVAAAATLTSATSILEFIKQINTAELSKIGAALIAASATILVSTASIFISRKDKKKTK